MICIQQKPEYFDFINQQLNVKFDLAQAVCITSLSPEGEIYGVVVFSRFTPHNCEMSVASASPKFLTRKFLNVIFHYAFITAGKTRVTAVSEEDNHRILDVNRRIGFVDEGRLKGWYGEKDGLILRMLRSECKWLEAKL